MKTLTAVDLFAGAGGSTTGAHLAGVKVLWAANHSPDAVQCHSRNHPDTVHTCQDLRQADWRDTPDHDILLASPACTGHTKARGKDRPHHDASRATSWAVVDCVEVKQPPFFVVENVPEFTNWRHYDRWRGCLEEDYRLTENLLDAADLAVPQNRVRLFVIGVHKRVSKSPITVTRLRLPQTPVRDIINWREPGWSLIEGHSSNTLKRIEGGRRQFGKEPFLIAYYGNAHGGRSLSRPLGTLTTKDRYALIDRQFMRMLTVGECKRAMGFPDNYWLPSCRSVAMKLLGNAVATPVMAHLLRQVKKVA